MYRLLQHDTAWFWSCPGTANRNSKYPPQAGSPWAANSNVEEHWPANFLLNEYSMATSIQKPMPATIKNPHSSNPNPRRICLSNNKTIRRSLDCTHKTTQCRWCIASHRPTSWQNLIYYYGFRVSNFVQFVYFVFFWFKFHKWHSQAWHECKNLPNSTRIFRQIYLAENHVYSIFNEAGQKLRQRVQKRAAKTKWQCFSGMHSITKNGQKKTRQ